MFCRKCGQQLDDSAQFCIGCGAPIEVEQTQEQPLQQEQSLQQEQPLPQEQPFQNVPHSSESYSQNVSAQQPVASQQQGQHYAEHNSLLPQGVPSNGSAPSLANKSKSKGLIIGLIVGIVAVALGAGLAIALLRHNGESVPVEGEPQSQNTQASQDQDAQASQETLDSQRETEAEPEVDPAQLVSPHIDDLYEGDTYYYDMDGDGETESLRVIFSNYEYDWFKTLDIYVDDALAYSYTDAYGIGYIDYYVLQAITLSSGRTLLYAYTPFNNGDAAICGIFRYDAGSMNMEADFNAFFSNDYKYGSHINGEVTSIDTERISAEIFIMSWTAGALSLYPEYSYDKDGHLTLSNPQNIPVSSYMSTGKTLTFSYGTDAYSRLDLSSSDKFFSAGSHCRLVQACVQQGRFLLQVEDADGDGSAYWIPCVEQYEDLPQDYSSGGTIFDETMLAG